MSIIPSRYLYKLLKRITGSIAFLPVLVSLLFVLSGIMFLYLEIQMKFPDLKRALQVVIVKDANTARDLIGILIGGVISLMVFSFSMVMLVLSQASTSLSPRVIPGLISDKRHQAVLGANLGTILYLTLIMINLQPEDGHVTLELNVLGGIILGVVCLCLFVYFIHTISNNIQVEMILQDIYEKGKKQICDENSRHEPVVVADPRERYDHVFRVPEEGYYNGFDRKALIDLVEKEDFKISIDVTHGSYLYRDSPLGFLTKAISPQCSRQLWRCFYVDSQLSNDHYYYNLKFISEIGVKALSPGINDPGTAVKALHLLTDLLTEKRKGRPANCHEDRAGTIRVWFAPLDIPFLIYHFYSPFRTYGKNDIKVMITYLKAIYQFMTLDINEKNLQRCLAENALALCDDVDRSISNRLDLSKWDDVIRSINDLNYLDFQLPTSSDAFKVTPADYTL